MIMEEIDINLIQKEKDNSNSTDEMKSQSVPFFHREIFILLDIGGSVPFLFGDTSK